MEQLILAILREKDKLKLSTLYQILIGKRTSSTICYAFFHDLLAYFGCLTQLEEESWYHTCQKLAKRGKVALEDGHISLTGQMNENRADFVLPGHINFYRFGKVDGVGWRLMQFFVQQVTTNGEHRSLENGSFYSYEVQKLLASRNGQAKEEVYVELQEAFQHFSDSEANLLARTLTGNKQIGETFYQILDDDLDTLTKRLLQANATHQFYQYFLQRPDSLIHELLKDWYRMGLNRSLLLTRELFLAGANVQEIAARRHLKESTVRDHLIEWAVNDPNFPFDSFDFSKVASQLDPLPLSVWLQNYKEVNQRERIDFLSFRLYQIKRKHEHGANQ